MPSSRDSWIYSFPGSQYVQHLGKEAMANILKAGRVPRHIAFVMDGNRRYAKLHNQETREGHNAGFESLSQILELCYNLGVECVTIFAFSIENFKRSPYEVNNLMELTKARLEQICERGDLAEQYGIRVKILGDTKLLRPDVLEVIERTTKITENNSKYVYIMVNLFQKKKSYINTRKHILTCILPFIELYLMSASHTQQETI